MAIHSQWVWKLVLYCRSVKYQSGSAQKSLDVHVPHCLPDLSRKVISNCSRCFGTMLFYVIHIGLIFTSRVIRSSLWVQSCRPASRISSDGTPYFYTKYGKYGDGVFFRSGTEQGAPVWKTLSFRRVDLPFSFEMINMIASTRCQDSRGENVMVVVFKRCSPVHVYFSSQACFAFFTTLFTKGPSRPITIFFFISFFSY